jgi:predicted small secreted protein
MADVAVARYAPGMNSSFRRLTILCLILTFALVGLATSACQTSKGFGKDVEKLGDKIQEKSS